MLHFRIKALCERNEPKFIVNARLLYLTFLHRREDKCQHHWRHSQTDLKWSIFHHTGVLLDSCQVLVWVCFGCNSLSLFRFQKKKKNFVRAEGERQRFENTFLRDHVTI